MKGIKLDGLNEKQRKFAECYVRNGHNAAEAYRVAYGCDNKKISSVSGYNLMKNPKVRAVIVGHEQSFRLLGAEIGVNRKTMISVINEMMHATKKKYTPMGVLIGEEPDWTARKNAIDMFNKLVGQTDKDMLPDPEDKIETPVMRQVENLTPEERDDYQRKLLKEAE